MNAPRPLAVLNPGGRDQEQSFAHFAGTPGDIVPHPPVNYHAYAACTGGSFHRSVECVPEERRDVLLVLRRDLGKCLKALEHLKGTGRKVAVTLKESGSHQVAQLLEKADNLRLFQEVCASADGCVASTSDLASLYAAAGGRKVRFIPTPYPVAEEEWNFAAEVSGRNGVFVGTREWDVPSRNHAMALLIARTLEAPVTVVNTDGKKGRKRVEAAAIPHLNVVEGALPYPDYLRTMARHRLVVQMDRSAVPGQVAGDALLCRLPCVGGDGAIERIAFPKTCGHGREPAELREIAAHLLRDEQAYAEAIEEAQHVARERLSFQAIAGELAAFFAELSL